MFSRRQNLVPLLLSTPSSIVVFIPHSQAILTPKFAPSRPLTLILVCSVSTLLMASLFCPLAAGGPVQQPAAGGHAAGGSRCHAVPVQLCLCASSTLCPECTGEQPPGVQGGPAWPQSSGELGVGGVGGSGLFSTLEGKLEYRMGAASGIS